MSKVFAEENREVFKRGKFSQNVRTVAGNGMSTQQQHPVVNRVTEQVFELLQKGLIFHLDIFTLKHLSLSI